MDIAVCELRMLANVVLDQGSATFLMSKNVIVFFSQPHL